MNKLSDQQWGKFFELLSLIVNGEGSWQDRSDQLADKAKEYGAESDLDEFANWHSES